MLSAQCIKGLFSKYTYLSIFDLFDSICQFSVIVPYWIILLYLDLFDLFAYSLMRQYFLAHLPVHLPGVEVSTPGKLVIDKSPPTVLRQVSQTYCLIRLRVLCYYVPIFVRSVLQYHIGLFYYLTLLLLYPTITHGCYIWTIILSMLKVRR